MIPPRAIFVLFAVVAVRQLGAQQKEVCQQIAMPNTHTGSVQVNGQTQTYIGGGVHIRCPKSGITIKSDSAEQYNVNTETGDKANNSTRTEVLEAWGNVVVTFVDGRSLKTAHLIYKRQLDDISSDTTFEISGPKGTYRGKGVSFDSGFTRFKCAMSCGGSSAVVVPNR